MTRDTMSERDWDEWLDALERNGVNLTTWEEEFVADMRALRERDGMLSVRQAETLESIYAKRTP